MYFASDNTGPAHPAVMQALQDANSGYQPSYGADTLMEEVRAQLRDIFEAPEAAVYLVATGTAANVLALATLTRPWETIFCAPRAHIQMDECNAPEFYSGGAKLTLVGQEDKITPAALERAITGWVKGDVHTSQRGPLSLTQATEWGQLYSVDEISALCAVAHAHDCPVHMDGARFANAVAALNVSPADMTWRAGVDALSFGGTKNGCLGVEAVIFFDPRHAWEFELRRKRGAHLFSKHRYLSAQMKGYLADGLWLQTAAAANTAGAKLADGMRGLPDCRILNEVQVNMIFATLPRATHQRLHAAGAAYSLYDGPLDEGPADAPLTARFVCDWSCDEGMIARFLDIARG